MDRGLSHILIRCGAGLGGGLRHALNMAIPSALRRFAATDMLGGYATVSTFSLESTPLPGRHDYIPAFAYVAGSVLFGVAGLWAAILATRSL